MFKGAPLNIQKLFSAKCFINFISTFMTKCIFYHFTIFFNTIMLFCQKRLLFTVKNLNNKKVLIDKNSKTGFSYMKKKKSKKPHKYKSFLKKECSECFSIKTIDPIRFMKMLWLIIANWCFQKFIGSGMVCGWSDTPHCKHIV